MSTPARTEPATIEHPVPTLADHEPLRYQRPEPPPIEDVARYYALSQEARFYSNGGPCHVRLAARLAEYAGAAACVPVSNCTLGLIVALRELCGVPSARRRLIATPAFTFTATACAIRWAGFEPLFVDIDPDAWQLDPGALHQALVRHRGAVAGVLACSTFGTAPPAGSRAGWRSACDEHGLPLLIDSAAGFGAVDAYGQPLGGQGDTEVFSFHATKPLAIGEGGAILTADPEVAARIARTINFGIDPNSRTSVVTGLNAKLPELLAAAGLAMLDRYDDVLARRRATARGLQSAVAHLPLTYQEGSEGSTWQVFQTLVPDGAARARLVATAAELEIEVRTCFDPPLHRHVAFAGAPVAAPLEVTERLAARALSLPMANSLGPSQMVRLAELIASVLEGERC
jgi:dTDP-4-amino-4,6-dideoxygalactose transaminase